MTAAVEQPKIEEIVSESPSEGEEDASPDGAGADGGEGGARARQNRSEKKSRKAVLKLGMKAVPGIVQVRIKKNKQVTFVIHDPEVFKSPTADTYVVFGEAKIEDHNALAQSAAAKAFAGQAPAGAAQGAKAAAAPPPPQKVEEVVEEEGPVDEEGIDEKDLALLLTQVQCSRARAVKALKDHEGDVVEAIMALTASG